MDWLAIAEEIDAPLRFVLAMERDYPRQWALANRVADRAMALQAAKNGTAVEPAATDLPSAQGAGKQLNIRPATPGGARG